MHVCRSSNSTHDLSIRAANRVHICDMALRRRLRTLISNGCHGLRLNCKVACSYQSPTARVPSSPICLARCGVRSCRSILSQLEHAIHISRRTVIYLASLSEKGNSLRYSSVPERPHVYPSTAASAQVLTRASVLFL